VTEKLTPIDEDNLAKEWIKHPRLVEKYALAHADAIAEHDEAVAALDIETADADARIRKRLAVKDEKLTETAIKSKIVSDSKVRQRAFKVRTLKHKKEILAATLKVLEHRKRALTCLVDLFALGYFSEPKPKRADRETINKLKQRSIRGGGRGSRRSSKGK
jgi:hypothetical protein